MTVQDYSSLPTLLQPTGYRVAVANAPLAAGTMALLAQDATLFSSLNCVDLNAFSGANCGSFLPMQVATPVVFYAKDGKWTVFEFETESSTWADRYRKLYNAVLNLERLNCRKMAEARTSVDYVLVTRQVSSKIRVPPSRQGARASMHQHLDPHDPEPWEYDTAAMRRMSEHVDHDVRRMSEYLVRKAFFIFPSELDLYVRRYGWKN